MMHQKIKVRKTISRILCFLFIFFCVCVCFFLVFLFVFLFSVLFIFVCVYVFCLEFCVFAVTCKQHGDRNSTHLFAFSHFFKFYSSVFKIGHYFAPIFFVFFAFSTGYLSTVNKCLSVLFQTILLHCAQMGFF